MTSAERIMQRFTSTVVYDDPIESNGSVVLPAARVSGGGGGGSDGSEGEGSGFGLSARPAGAWVVKDGNAQWKPAINVNAIIAGAYAVAIAYLYFTSRIRRAEAKHR